MIVPFQDIKPETLKAICEDWLTRQSQEWLGDTSDRSSAVDSVLEALKSKQLFISWDEEMNSLDIISADQLNAMQNPTQTHFEN